MRFLVSEVTHAGEHHGHAMLVGGDSHFTVKDMSRAGTFLNGRKIEQARLANGAKLSLGQSQLVYHERR